MPAGDRAERIDTGEHGQAEGEEGLFIKALDRELKRRRLTVPALEHDLAAELRGQRQAVLATRSSRTLGGSTQPKLVTSQESTRASTTAPFVS